MADDKISEQPVSPVAQYLNSPILSLSILGVLEFQVPIHTLDINSFILNVFLHMNPRFSSIMITTEKGEQKWKRVNVKVEEHVKDPIFPSDLTTESYKTEFDDYLTDISMEQFRPERPLFEFHLFKYPTSKTSAGTVVLKVHHSLGDGYSLMGVVLSCLHRASDPRLPLTFPTRKRGFYQFGDKGGLKMVVPRILSSIYRTVSDLGWSFLKINDDETPIRLGVEGVEFMPMITSTISFSLDDIKKIKTMLGVEVAKFLHNLLKNTSTLISNVIGPEEQMAFENFPIDALYFTIVGTPQSVTMTGFSYMGNVRVALRTQKGFINAHKLNSCMEDAFNKILKAAAI